MPVCVWLLVLMVEVTEMRMLVRKLGAVKVVVDVVRLDGVERGVWIIDWIVAFSCAVLVFSIVEDGGEWCSLVVDLDVVCCCSCTLLVTLPTDVLTAEGDWVVELSSAVLLLSCSKVVIGNASVLCPSTRIVLVLVASEAFPAEVSSLAIPFAVLVLVFDVLVRVWSSVTIYLVVATIVVG